MSPPTTSARRRVVRPSKPAFQEPLSPSLDPGRPKVHKGIPILSEVPRMSPLPGIKAPMKISKLHLEGDVEAFACVDCLFTGDTLAEVMHHRNERHGSKYGKKKPKVTFPRDENPMDIVLPPRAIDIPAPDQIMEMTIAEVMSLLPSIRALGALVEHLEKENEKLRTEADDRTTFDSTNRDKLANYDALQAELVERRMLMKGGGSYEDLKAEVTELRAWKRLMKKRLQGFFTEEEKQ